MIHDRAAFEMLSLDDCRERYRCLVQDGAGRDYTWARSLAELQELGEITREQLARWVNMPSQPEKKTTRRDTTMQLTDDGLRMSKAALGCLLAFCSKDASSSYNSIHFKAIKGSRGEPGELKVRASTGKIAVDCKGPNLTKKANEWTISREFLSKVHKVAESDNVILIRTAGKSVRDAALLNKSGEECGEYHWTKDASNSQTSFADENEWDELLKLPGSERGIKMLGLRAGALPLIKKLEAVSEAQEVQLYVNDSGRMLGYATTDDTTWLAMLDPDPNAEEEG